ncbi:hypothetical protein KSP39_PZI003525 [Platanthera zijinensis]|uniref:NAD(+) kinase n=1 Tax=Platanthera zijinensis TaxID=2320716 RepID=A0AAP0GCS8_9ASPA
MLASCGAYGPVKFSIIAGEMTERCSGVIGYLWPKAKRFMLVARRGGGDGKALRSFVDRAWFSSFLPSRINLDLQTLQTSDPSQLLWVGPLPGDIAEIEAYCRIFRAAEQFHTCLMEIICNPETGECPVSYETSSEDMRFLEEQVVAALGCMLALLSRGREEVLSGRSSFINSFQSAAIDTAEGKLPPLALFRDDMKRCSESLEVALVNYFKPLEDNQSNIWRRLQRLKNVCYDAGFSRRDGDPSPTLFANWSPVLFSTVKEGIALDNHEVAFWRGGQVTVEGLTWLLEEEFKTIVDLREEESKDEDYRSAMEQAVLSGKIKVVNFSVQAGTAPSMEQVEQFSFLVSDPSRKPIYLHSQEGVNRTSAMVSRWRQYVTRAEMNSVKKNSLVYDGKPLKIEKSLEDQKLLDINPQNVPGCTVIDAQNDRGFTEIEHFKGKLSDQDVSTSKKENQNGNLTPKPVLTDNLVLNHRSDGIDPGKSLYFSFEKDPLNAQLPKCDMFSRKEMIQFLQNRKSSPEFYFNSFRKKFKDASISRKTYKPPFQTSETHAVADTSQWMQSRNSNGKPGNGGYEYGVNLTNGKHLKNESSSSLNFGVNDFNEEKRYGVLGDETKGSIDIRSSFSGQAISASTKRKNGENGKVSSSSVGENLDLLGENMCSSATGVVRVQSRKKAEMFLVRTDGFTCTREKVTESSLAFTHPSTQQQMLMWKSPPRTVLLLKKLGQELMEQAKEVASFLYHQKKMNVLVEPDVHDVFARIPGFGFVQTFYIQDTSDLHERVDFVTCLGGDGVILHASNLFRGAVPPVVSFNLGSLGFLTSHEFQDYRHDLEAVIHGNNSLDGVYITLRMRLQCEIFRNGKTIPGKICDVLNEVVVDRGSNPYLSKIECYEHKRLITKVQGDGVIIATPTGSTAYSTAAGGSMVHPNVPCMLFTPICPHSLSFRPVILPDSAQLELKIPNDARSNAWVSFDGKRRQQLSRGDAVRICMSPHPLPTVNKCDQTGDWFHSLVRCLNWNDRLDQKAL